MNGEPSQAEIARALGLAKSRVTALKKQGMPVHSIDAAREWRLRNVAPVPPTLQRGARPLTRLAIDTEADIRHVVALGQLAEVAIDKGTFHAIEPSLRLALAAIPLAHRDKMPGLPVKVWDALCADVSTLLPQGEPGTEGGNAAPDDDEEEYMARFWYAVAAGEVRPNR